MTNLYLRGVKALLALFATSLGLSLVLLVGISNTDILSGTTERVAETMLFAIAIFSGIWVLASAAYLIQGDRGTRP